MAYYCSVIYTILDMQGKYNKVIIFRDSSEYRIHILSVPGTNNYNYYNTAGAHNNLKCMLYAYCVCSMPIYLNTVTSKPKATLIHVLH